MTEIVHVSRLKRWAQERRDQAHSEYSSDGRSGYGDIAGMIEVYDDIIGWCENGTWSECFDCDSPIDADGRCTRNPEHEQAASYP